MKARKYNLVSTAYGKSLHGHTVPMRRFNTKNISGYMHVPERQDGAVSVGHSTDGVDMPAYAKGQPSGWMRATAVVVGTNDKAQLIHFDQTKPIYSGGSN